MKRVSASLIIIAMVVYAGAAMACYPGHPSYPACAQGSVAKTWIDIYNPADVFFGTGGVNTYSFAFDIKDSGFVPGQDWVNSYGIKFNFTDDQDRWFTGEQAKVTVDNRNYYTTDWLWSIDDLGISFKGTTSLNSNGTLSTTITRLYGDFYFSDATLTAEGCDYTPPTSTPEPASMILFGLGLLAVAGFKRKMKI